MRVEQQPAYVLHQRNFSETSLLVELFTPGYGRLTVLAKGARRSSSPFRGTLRPFQLLSAGWVGRGELPILTTAEVSTPRNVPHGPALYCGFYLNELLCRLMHRHDPHVQVFERYDQAMGEICDSPLREATLRLFELDLLRELGYGPVLDRDVQTGESIEPSAKYEYVRERGPVRVAQAPVSGRARALQLQGETLIALANGRLESPLSLHESKRLMRMLLAGHLGAEPLHSRRLMQRAVDARARSNAATAANTMPADSAKERQPEDD